MSKNHSKKQSQTGCLIWLLAIAFFPITISIWFWKSEFVQSKKTKAIILAMVWFILLLIGGISANGERANSDPLPSEAEADQITRAVTEVAKEPTIETTFSYDSTAEASETKIPETTEVKESTAAAIEPAKAGMDYVLNTGTMKFHYPSCSSVSKIKSGNRGDYTGSADDIMARGYSPCKKCNPR